VISAVWLESINVLARFSISVDPIIALSFMRHSVVHKRIMRAPTTLSAQSRGPQPSPLEPQRVAFRCPSRTLPVNAWLQHKTANRAGRADMFSLLVNGMTLFPLLVPFFIGDHSVLYLECFAQRTVAVMQSSF
jgi:hypothetical protein